LRLIGSPGVRGAWMPPISGRDYRDQLEFLLAHRTRILLGEWDVGRRRLIINAEVLP